MKASIVDLRYRTGEILRALARREQVQVLYHGKIKGTIVPAAAGKVRPAAEHPFFGMAAADEPPVEEVVRSLRGGRYGGNARHYRALKDLDFRAFRP